MYALDPIAVLDRLSLSASLASELAAASGTSCPDSGIPAASGEITGSVTNNPNGKPLPKPEFAT